MFNIICIILFIVLFIGVFVLYLKMQDLEGAMIKFLLEHDFKKDDKNK